MLHHETHRSAYKNQGIITTSFLLADYSQHQTRHALYKHYAGRRFQPLATSAAPPLSSASGSLSSAWSSLWECPSAYFGSTKVLQQGPGSLNASIKFSCCGGRGSLIQGTPVTDLKELVTFSRRVGTRNQAATFSTGTAGVHRAHLTRGSGIFSNTEIFSVSHSCIFAYLSISLQRCQLDATFQHQSHHCQ